MLWSTKDTSWRQACTEVAPIGFQWLDLERVMMGKKFTGQVYGIFLILSGSWGCAQLCVVVLKDMKSP